MKEKKNSGVHFGEQFHQVKRIELIKGGRDLFELLNKLIGQASFEIHIQFYILENDDTGRPVIDALIDAAKKGVQVYLVLDSYGSSNLEEKEIEKMTTAGVRFKWFKPVIALNNMEFGRRLHHKVVVIDEQIALVTGVNIADRYNDIHGHVAWLDFAMLVEGTTAGEIRLRCLQIWEQPHSFLKIKKKFSLPRIDRSLRSENALVKVSVNDWLRSRNDIYRGYKSAFQDAKQEIFIIGGYFLPGRGLRKNLKDASQRGVHISVILTAVSDVRFAKSAEKYLYSWMLQNNIQIYEWLPAVMHGKVAAVDCNWSTVGSYNLNYLSNFESIELNLEIIDNRFSTELTTMMKDIALNQCRRIFPEEFYRNYSMIKKIEMRFSYWFARTTMRILNAFSRKPTIN
ncbi:MAG: phospholipase D-like domain-containing protein [Vicingaceae bacterium]